MTMTQATSSPAQRAEDLLAQMTIEEKAFQLSAVMPTALFGTEGPITAVLDAQLGLGIGHVSAIGTFGHKTPVTLAKAVNAIQRHLVEHTRLGIPAIFHNEALNGVVAPGFTAFPTAIGLAATWRPDQVQAMTEHIRSQMRVVGLRQSLSPVMDVARDARWGRVHETFGEDPYLGSAMSVAYVRGLQGDDLSTGVIATAKHFLGYAITEGGQNMAATQIVERDLVEVHTRAFEAAIRLAGLGSVMNSYSEYNGVPIGASHEILTNLLRGRLGFDGTVVSDYATVDFLRNRQLVASTAEEAGSLALAAGIDVELPSVFGYGKVLAEAVRNGTVPEELLDQSVRRVLRDKFALGIFDHPYVDEDPIVITQQAKLGTDLSHELAQQSVTLLKNENGVLPLSDDVHRIAVIGPHADDVTIGFPAYTYPAAIDLMKSLAGGGDGAMAGIDSFGEMFSKDAVAAMAAEMAPVLTGDAGSYIRANYGAVSLADALRELLPDASVDVVGGTGVVPSDPSDIAAAVDAARAADVVVLALGGRGGWFASEITEGEGSDSSNIDLPAHQIELACAVVATGTPTVAVVSVGRPYGLTDLEALVPGIVLGYYGGPEHGRALAEVLVGRSNPGGKLPYTLPRTTGQVPIYSAQHNGTGYRRASTDMHQGYIDGRSTPLFPFGHGLSYTTFGYSELAVEEQSMPTTGVIGATVTVTNTGGMAGDEVVQFYVADTATGVTRPALQLVGFIRLGLKPGESATITARIPVSLLGYVGLSGDLIVEPGRVTVHAAASSSDLRTSADVELVGQTTTLDDSRAFLADVEAISTGAM